MNLAQHRARLSTAGAPTGFIGEHGQLIEDDRPPCCELCHRRIAVDVITWLDLETDDIADATVRSRGLCGRCVMISVLAPPGPGPRPGDHWDGVDHLVAGQCRRQTTLVRRVLGPRPLSETTPPAVIARLAELGKMPQPAWWWRQQAHRASGGPL